MRTLHLSASSIAAFKACPTRFRLAYVDGIRPAEDKESQRVGTNWHKLHEIYRIAQANGGYTADGTGALLDPFESAMTELGRLYATVPDGFDAVAWAVEYQILANSFAAYCWLYKNDPVETLATELEFKLPVIHPLTGMPLSTEEVVRVGKIDRVIRRNGIVSIADYKSTSKPIDADSQFWNHLRLDSQINMYVLAATELHAAGQLPGVGPEEIVSGAFYDVWHKPQIKPSKLTQAETKAFMENGQYCDQEFTVRQSEGGIFVNDEQVEVEPGKKEGAFAIRESPAMFGARLRQDIIANPDKYFARREIARTQDDVQRFRQELYHTYQSMKAAIQSGHFIHNEQQCEATFRCPYTSLCYHGQDRVPADETPSGFKRIFADLTIEREQVEL